MRPYNEIFEIAKDPSKYGLDSNMKTLLEWVLDTKSNKDAIVLPETGKVKAFMTDIFEPEIETRDGVIQTTFDIQNSFAETVRRVHTAIKPMLNYMRSYNAGWNTIYHYDFNRKDFTEADFNKLDNHKWPSHIGDDDLIRAVIFNYTVNSETDKPVTVEIVVERTGDYVRGYTPQLTLLSNVIEDIQGFGNTLNRMYHFRADKQKENI